MQTFLPYPDFRQSLQALDDRRLGKQRVEARQILDILSGRATSKAWRSHPAVRMWQGFETALKLYYNTALEEWAARGHYNWLLQPVKIDEPVVMPPWLGDDDFHTSHKSNLLRKNPDHYEPIFWPFTDASLGYIWPLPKEQACPVSS